MVPPDPRDRLRGRQAAVLDDLLRGRVPDGFDARGAALTSRVLAVKRAGSAARACPSLAELPGWPRVFIDYAEAHPKTDCSAHDARSYIAWLRDNGTPEQRSWVAVETVRSGARRWSFAHGRLVFRFGGRVVVRPRARAR